MHTRFALPLLCAAALLLGACSASDNGPSDQTSGPASTTSSMATSAASADTTAAAATTAGANEPATATSTNTPAWLTAAINDPARGDDKANDQRRKMRAVMLFTGVEPGDTVVELSPGSGYWTRVFSDVVGGSGHVYTIWPEQMAKYSAKNMAMWKELAAKPTYANVRVLEQSAQTLDVPTKADIVFTSQNYHDYHNIDIDIEQFDQSVYDSLKPGGVFIVIDHAAPAGSGTSDTDTLHRIDPAAVKKEIEAAGFEFAGSSDALQNTDDPLDIPVFDESIRGYTDQFIYRFRKPESSQPGNAESTAGE